MHRNHLFAKLQEQFFHNAAVAVNDNGPVFNLLRADSCKVLLIVFTHIFHGFMECVRLIDLIEMSGKVQAVSGLQAVQKHS